MLGQEIHIESSLSDESVILSSVTILDRSLSISQFQSQGCADNCLENIKEADENLKCSNPIETKLELEKLKVAYHKALNQLNEAEQYLSIEESVRFEAINKLKACLNEVYQKEKLRERKGSQISTAGEDEEIRANSEENEKKITENSYETIKELERKLEELRNINGRVNKEEIERIAYLKNELEVSADNSITEEKGEIHQKVIKDASTEEIFHKLNEMRLRKEGLLKMKETIETKIREEKVNIVQLENSTEYLRSTQTCCQEILNEELTSINYKLSTRKAEYESAKRYLDKIIRSRKYEENVSFKEILNQINYLNTYCDEMIEKKSQITPEIKKYKHKRHAITEQIKQNYQIIKEIEIKKSNLNIKIHEQNVTYAEMQDEYYLLVEDQYEKRSTMSENLTPEEQCSILNEKKEILSHELKTIINLSQEAKLEIETNQNLVPQSILKDFEKKIKKKKQEAINSSNIFKEISQLETENQLLHLEKHQIEWKTNPDLEKLIEEEKSLTFNHSELKDTVKTLKEEHESLEEKIAKFEEYITGKKEEAKKMAAMERDLKEKALINQEKKQYDGRKLMEKFRERKRSDDDYSDEEVNNHEKMNESQQSLKKVKTKKGKINNPNNFEQEMSRSKGKEFYSVKKTTPIERLRKKFPINSSEETFSNSSLVASNPALWMFVFFVTVVIPGLCIGYNF